MMGQAMFVSVPFCLVAVELVVGFGRARFYPCLKMFRGDAVEGNDMLLTANRNLPVEVFNHFGCQEEACPNTSDQIGLILVQLAKRSSITDVCFISMEVGHCFHHARVNYKRSSRLPLLTNFDIPLYFCQLTMQASILSPKISPSAPSKAP